MGPTPNRQLLALGLSLVVVGLSLLPWASPMLSVVSSPAGSGGLGPSPQSLQSSLLFIGDVLLSFSGVDGLWLVVWLGLFVLGLARSTAKAIMLVLLGIATPFVFLAMITPDHPLIPKYVLFWLPLCLLAVARGLTACADLIRALLLRHVGESKSSLIAPQAVTVLLFATLSAMPLRDYYLWDKEDWRAVASYLRQNMGSTDVIVADGQGYGEGADANRTSKALTYYFSLQDWDVTILHAQRGLAAKAQQSSRPGSHIWGVLWHFDDLADSSVSRGEVEILELPSVAVVKLTEPKGSPLGDTVSVLEAMADIQPRPVGRFDLHLALSELYLELGIPDEAAQQGRLAGEAAQEYAEEAALDPTRSSPAWDWRPYWDLGTTYEQLGMLQQAADAYEQVLLIDPGHLQAHLRLGEAYWNLDEPSKAVVAFEQALQIDPENPEVYFRLGEAYQGLGRIADAVVAYEQVLSITPNDEWARTRLKLLSQPVEEEIPHPLLRSLGRQIALLGYDLSATTLEPGRSLDITLWWQALADMETDYTVFIHLTTPDGHVWAQSDALLVEGQRPTSDWRVGLVARADHQLNIPGDAPPGEYAVLLGVYSWATGERLPVWDEHGQRETGDATAISTIVLPQSAVAD